MGVARNVSFFMVPSIQLSCVNLRFVLDCANSGRPTLLLLLLLLLQLVLPMQSPMLSRGSPLLHSGGQNQKCPTCGQSGYVTPAVSGIPTASERGARSEVAHKWAKWLRHPCLLGDPHRFRAGGKIRSGPLVGKVATSPLPPRGSPPLQSGGNQKWPTSGQSGYVNPAVSGIATTLERLARSEVAHKWAKWLRHPCRLGYPRRLRAGGKFRSGPQVGKVATSPLPPRGSPPLQSGGQDEKWPTCGQSG